MPLLAVDWDYIGENMFSGIVFEGMWMTVRLAVFGMALGIALGIIFALMRLAKAWPLKALALLYIWFFRGTPLLVQIVFWFFALPQVWPEWLLTDGRMSAFQTAIFALAINEGAYMTEIVRAGIQSVDAGQTEAAKSLGMTYPTTMRRIVLPQALRVVIPPTGNEFIAMLKNSSLVSAISVSELFLVARLQYSSTLRYFEWLIIVSFWYLVLTTIASIVQAWLEGRYGPDRYTDRDSGAWLRRLRFVRARD